MSFSEFMDIFGFFAFAYITIIGILILKNKRLPKWAKIILLLIAIGGLLVDGFIVIKTFLI